MVSAWAGQTGITLGQVAVDTKSNEITAMPQLLELLDFHDKIVTIDAMGCQKAIAQTIVEGGGDYIFAVKDESAHLARGDSSRLCHRRHAPGPVLAALLRRKTTATGARNSARSRCCPHAATVGGATGGVAGRAYARHGHPRGVV